MMNYSVTKNNKMLSLGLIAFGVAGIAYGFATDHTRVWASLLHSNFYLLAVANQLITRQELIDSRQKRSTQRKLKSGRSIRYK